VILAQKTIIYDIIEADDRFRCRYRPLFGRNRPGLAAPCPRRSRSPSGRSSPPTATSSRRISPSLIQRYNASVADWESGAIAWVARCNQVPCLILRAVSDLVDETSGEAYGDIGFFERQCQAIMAEFAQHLPGWLSAFKTVL
jgi:hypothetical protein